MVISDLNTNYSEAVAKLHIQGINIGFISSLGLKFVTSLYEAVAQSNSSFGYVAEEDGKVLGFIAFTPNLSKLYKSVILKKGCRFALLLAGKMFSMKRIKKVFETFFYPGTMKKMALPCAELLSIVVAEEARGKGLATELVKKGLEACRLRGIEKVKVLVGADNEPANRLYLHCGFELFGRVMNHGVLSNIYVRRTNLV